MSYEFVSLEDAGKRTGDFIMRLRWRPSQLRRWFGAQEEVVAYYGQGAKWHAMDGLPARSHVRALLEELWHHNQPRCNADRETSELAECTAHRIPSAYCDLVEVASEDSFPASDPPAWTLGR